MPKLYIVPTPIGNLKDITLRALEILRSADLIICENTLNSQSLLKHYDIKATLTSYNDNSNANSRANLVRKILQHNNSCLISDAGTPLISDPGYKLIQKCIENNIIIDALPGACAAITAIVSSSLPAAHFMFFGFLPDSGKKRLESLEKLKNFENITIILYESSSRIIKLLKEINTILSSKTQISVSKELTKTYQNTYRGTVSEVLESMNSDQNSTKGEFVICIYVPKKNIDNKQLIEKYSSLKVASTKDLAAFISENENISKTEAYSICLDIKSE